MLLALALAEHDDDFQAKSNFANGCMPMFSFASLGKRIERSLTVGRGRISSPFPLQVRAGGVAADRSFTSPNFQTLGTLPTLQKSASF